MKGSKLLVFAVLALLMACVFLPTQRASALGPSACATASGTSAALFAVNPGRKGVFCQNVGASITGYISVGNGATGCVAGTAGNAIQVTPSAIFELSAICPSGSGCVPTGDLSICTASSVTTFCCFEW